MFWGTQWEAPRLGDSFADSNNILSCWFLMRSSRMHCCNLRDSSCKPSPGDKHGPSGSGLAKGELVKCCFEMVPRGACSKGSWRGCEVIKILQFKLSVNVRSRDQSSG